MHLTPLLAKPFAPSPTRRVAYETFGLLSLHRAHDRKEVVPRLRGPLARGAGCGAPSRRPCARSPPLTVALAACADVECTRNNDCGDRTRCEMNHRVSNCRSDRDCPGGRPLARLRRRALPRRHVGDARAYRLRDGALERMTRDRSLAEEFGDTPEVARYIAENPTFQAVVTRALGVAEACEPAVRAHPTRDDDVWLLASDGLWRTVPGDDLARLAGARWLDEAVLDLIAASYARDPNDNLSVVLLKGAHEPDTARPVVRSAPLPAFESSPPPPTGRVLGLLDGETDARAAWEAPAARGVIPDDWIEHPARRFFGAWEEHPKGLPDSADCLREHRDPRRVVHPYGASIRWGSVSEAPVLTHPPTVREVTLFAVPPCGGLGAWRASTPPATIAKRRSILRCAARYPQ